MLVRIHALTVSDSEEQQGGKTMAKVWNEQMRAWVYGDSKAESLFEAVKQKNKKAIAHFDEAIERGDIIRII